MLEKKIFRLSDKISKILSVVILVSFVAINLLDIELQSKLYLVSFISSIVIFIVATIVKYSIIIKKL